MFTPILIKFGFLIHNFSYIAQEQNDGLLN